MTGIRQVSNSSQPPVDIDIRTTSDGLSFDLINNNGDVGVTSELHTTVLVSLFTNRRAPEDMIVEGDSLGNRQGWWGDIYPKNEGDQIGSLLWTIGRQVITQKVMNTAREACQEALSWMITDGIATQIDISVVRVPLRIDTIGIIVKINRPNGDIIDFTFNYAWEAQANAV